MKTQRLVLPFIFCISLASCAILASCALFDTIKPTVEIDSPNNNSSYPTGKRKIRGKASDNVGVKSVEVRIDDSDFSQASGDEEWEYVYTFRSVSSYRITVRALDMSGNYGYTSITIKTFMPSNSSGDHAPVK